MIGNWSKIQSKPRNFGQGDGEKGSQSCLDLRYPHSSLTLLVGYSRNILSKERNLGRGKLESEIILLDYLYMCIYG